MDVWQVKYCLQPTTAFLNMSTTPPETPQRRAQPQSHVAGLRSDCIIQCHAQVVVLFFHSFQACDHQRVSEMLFTAFGQIGKKGDVPELCFFDLISDF